MRFWPALIASLFLGSLACGSAKNPCVERAELGCQMGLSLAQGEDAERARQACEEAKKSAEEADEEMQKKCAQDIAAFRSDPKKADLTPQATPPASETEPVIKRSKTGEPIIAPDSAASPPAAP